MVRQVSSQIFTTRKAAVLMLAAMGILLWHLLACTESPMAFSPDGKSLAIVTMEPYYEGKVDLRLAGSHCYRLIVASNQKDLRVIENTTDAMLTAPAYSPDGSQMCYVRFPLLSKEQLQRLDNASVEARKRWEEGTRLGTTAPASQPATSQASSSPATAEVSWHTDDLTLPDVVKTMHLLQQVTTNTPAKAELVIRQARDYSIIKTIPIDLHGIRWNTSKEESDIYVVYLTLRPQFSADGQWIYLCVGDVLLAVNPDRMAQRILAAPATSAALSPDGKTIAFFKEPAIGLMRTDGSKATYVRWNGTPCWGGLAWVDNGTLAILSKGPPAVSGRNTTPATGEASDALIITFMRADGTILSSPQISLPAKGNEDVLDELAISNNGRHIVVSVESKVYFLDSRGRIVKLIDLDDKATSQPDAKQILVQPTFSPDSSSVAFKSIVDDKNGARTGAIVFFSPDGKELSRVAIPMIRPGTTRPADEAR
jgi:Tol biopolymer transport system component